MGLTTHCFWVLGKLTFYLASPLRVPDCTTACFRPVLALCSRAVSCVLTLGAVFQLFRKVHLNPSCVAELCKLLDILQKLFVQHHFFKSNVGRSVRLQPFLLPSHSSCQPWVTALVKVVVATPFVLDGDVVENRLPLFPKDICIAITCSGARPEVIRY